MQQERERPGFTIDDQDEREQTTVEQLKQMKILPLKGQTQLVSIVEFQPRTIFLPLDKSIAYSKHVRLVLEDLPTIDERLFDYIEQKYPHRLDSIKRLLKDLGKIDEFSSIISHFLYLFLPIHIGISESRNSRRIFSNHILPIMSDLEQWLTKPDAVLLAYTIFIYKELYCPNPGHFASDMEKLKTTLILKIGQGKFMRLNPNGPNIIHLPLSYGCSISLESLKLPKYRFTFISDDYFRQYKQEIFSQERECRQFVRFLNELDVEEFFFVRRVQSSK